ncbi:sigma-70 family RNA polymerase sigma factor [Parvularcula lutaonensis]|uniref:Sigma-70 family RNA polymerase sigma factor n=1 Tax=Parvularcula lutaonensis TaxID=491923 RepID=A0ABV7M9U6_9PROT|nr:sigma-70 family RNA polymerase sigma factor [Parvularcula lutaonensis]GGY43438.1 RNA polymerase sigma factor [Parvularcula lutaonensis]
MTGTPQLRVIDGKTASSRPVTDLSGLGRLMAEAQAGDKRAYNQVLKACDAWLRVFLARRVAPESVEDIAQEALMALHRKRHTYDPDKPFAPWFVAIARYKWLDRLRQHYRAEEVELEDQASVGGHESAVMSRIVLERLLAHIPENQAQAIRLAKIDGYALDEIAQMTGQSLSSVKVRIHRGMKRMMKKLEESHA